MYQKAVELLVQIASLQTVFVILDEVIKITNRRVNAIEHVIIPKVKFFNITAYYYVTTIFKSFLIEWQIENTIKFVTSDLDEQDREEFFRLKKIQGKKKDRVIADEAQRQIILDAQLQNGMANVSLGAHSLLTEYEQDPDIMF